MTKKTYQVASPIRYDGKDYAAGDQVDLEDKDASDLLGVKAIEPSTTSNTPSAPTDDAERIAAIVAAIGQLDASDASLWMKSGAPKTEAIAAVTGWPVAGKERDAAHALIKAAK